MLLWFCFLFCFAFKCNTHLLGANSAVFSPIWKIRTRKKTGSPRSKNRCYNACFLQLIGVLLGYWRQVMWPLWPSSKFKWVSPDKAFIISSTQCYYQWGNWVPVIYSRKPRFIFKVHKIVFPFTPDVLSFKTGS